MARVHLYGEMIREDMLTSTPALALEFTDGASTDGSPEKWDTNSHLGTHIESGRVWLSTRFWQSTPIAGIGICSQESTMQHWRSQAHMVLRDLGNGLIIRRSTPDDAEALAAFNARM